MGTPDFAVESLDAIVKAGYEVAAVVTVPDRQSGRGLKTIPSPVKMYAVEHGLPFLQPEKLRDPLFLEELAKTGADIFVVVAFRMLPQAVWAMPRLGTFNLHASLLPQYRGAAPINWAVINGEKETGVTTFLLNEHIDEGRILLQRSTPITLDDNAGTVHDRLAAMGAELVVQTLDGLFSGSIQPSAQPTIDLLKPAPKIFKQDCAIDWHKKGQSIVDFVRGLSPYPAATATMTDEKGNPITIKIYETCHEPSENQGVGTLITDRKKVLKIGVSDGFLHILSLQMSGKKRISIEEFLRGYNPTDWKIVI